MPNTINNIKTKNTIILNKDSIVMTNNSKKCLVTFLRGLVAQYLEVNSSVLTTKFKKNNFNDDKLTTYSEQFNVWIKGESVDFDFEGFQKWILENRINKNLIIDKRIDVTQEEDVQEFLINLYHPSEIPNLHSALKQALSYIETPKLLSFAHWVTSSNNRDEMNEAKITSILLDELSRRKNFSGNNWKCLQ